MFALVVFDFVFQ